MKHLMLSRLQRFMYGRKRKRNEKTESIEKTGKKRKHNQVVVANSEDKEDEVSGLISEDKDKDISTKVAVAIASPSVVTVFTRGVPVLAAGVPKILRVVVTGDEGTGKSSFILNAKYHSSPVNLQATLELIDTASSGQNLDEELKKADAVVLAHACDDPSTLDHVHTLWLPRLRQLQVKVPVIVVGCKMDLQDEQDKVQLKHSTSKVMENNPEIEACIQCSVKKSIGIHKVLGSCRIAMVYPSAPLFDQNGMLRPRCISALRGIFRLLDTDKDGCLSKRDMDYFENRCFNTRLDRSEMNYYISNDRGLKLKGFCFYYAQFRNEGRLDLAWKVLKEFGYNDDIKFDKFDTDDFLPIIKRTLNKNVELTNEAVEFLKETFSIYDTDGDGTLKTSELEDIISSAPESPWSEAPYLDAAEMGGLSIDGFLSEWALMTVRDPVRSVMNLMYIGYGNNPFSAILVTERSCIDRERNQSDRNVFQCFVFGPKKAGKSELLNALIGRPFSDSYIPTKEERYAVNIVDKHGVNKTLIMREIPEDAFQHLLSNKDAFAACDIAVFVFDSSSEPSWKRTVKLLRKVKCHGYKGPSMIVSSKVDLDSHIKAPESSNRVCLDMRIDSPIPISTKKGNFNDVFKKIIVAAEHPHLSIPGKQYHHLANRPFVFESDALRKDLVEIKDYVWMTLSDVKDSPLRVGGALCIDPSGILITTVIATCQSPEFSLEREPKEDQRKTFLKSDIPSSVQAMKGGQVWRAKLEKICENYGVLFYRIVTKDSSERFPCLNLETVGNVRLKKEDRLYGYIHEGGPSLDFSYVRGMNNFRFPPNDVSFTEGKPMGCMTEAERDELIDRSIQKNAPYRTIGGVVDQEIHGVLCIPIEASPMLCDLPLLQVTGLGVETYKGQSGCPVFKCEGDDLLGLILFTKGYYTFILPVSVLLYCVNMLYMDMRHRDTEEKDRGLYNIIYS